MSIVVATSISYLSLSQIDGFKNLLLNLLDTVGAILCNTTPKTVYPCVLGTHPCIKHSVIC